jgi:hypothetical protein
MPYLADMSSRWRLMFSDLAVSLLVYIPVGLLLLLRSHCLQIFSGGFTTSIINNSILLYEGTSPLSITRFFFNCSSIVLLHSEYH